jgi:hypothetical protein
LTTLSRPASKDQAADAEKSAVLALLGAGEPSSQANLAAGTGGNLDISV